MLDASQLPVWYPAPAYPPAPDPIVREIVSPGPGGPILLVQELWYPVRPLDLVRSHLEVALRQIQAKRLLLDRRWTYYLGHHSEKVLSKKLLEVVQRSAQITSLFTNYCSLVVDAPLARLRVTGWHGNQADIDVADALWEDNDLDLEAEEIHRHAICAGEVFVTVWARSDPDTGEAVYDDEGNLVYDIALQDSRNIHLEFHSRRRRDRAWAAKVWLDHGRWRAVMYYPDEIIRMVAEPPATPPGPCPQDPLDFSLDMDDPGSPHSFGAVPVVRFSRSWDGRSRLDDCVAVQDRINKLTADKIVTAEFMAYPQRWALTNDDPPADALRAGPGGVWVIAPSSQSSIGGPETATTVGQFPSANLANYDNTIRQEVNAFFTIAQLPRHLLIDPGVSPSAQAVLADEAPLVASVRGYRDMFSASWEDVFELLGLDIEPVWQDIEVHNELTAAQTMRELTTSGLPLRMAAQFALNLDEEALAELDALPVPPQPGAGVPGQAAQPDTAPQDDQAA